MARRRQLNNNKPKPVVAAQAEEVVELEPDKEETIEETLDIIRLICAFFLPPLGVFLQVGLGVHFWLNLPLTFFGWIPGMVHAVYVILTKRD